ncbi:hypothetical protein PV04_09778 [Phialophora macrospora]|uniref:CENP-V/GFA domain-containing protein n=1 Tax=Phialophora macrospora TaxID=1851006 RepID=A0A0D2CCU8_9EURO|nr:hypothetical protein PV04_09778 [Phialophora macrospora]
MAHGSCLCGKVTYEAAIPVDASGKRRETHLCHCRMCRKITSAYTSANLDVPASDFHLTSGELKRIRTTHADDGFEFSILFCPDCGSAIYAEPHIEGWNDVVIIQAGTLDDPVEILEARPAVELNTKCRMPWIAKVEGAQQKEGY